MSTQTAPSFSFLKPRVSNKMHAGIKTADIIGLFRQLTTLFRAGTPLLEALVIASAQTQSSNLSVVIKSVSDKVAAGTPLYLAMSEHPKHFKTEWIEVIRSGEDSGQLGTVLETLTDQMISADQMRSSIVSSMMYPAIIAVVAVGAVTVMLIWVVPTFARMFNEFGKELPGITQMVLGISKFLQERWLYLVGGIGGTVLSVRHYVNTPGGRQVWHRLLVSLPLLGEITVQVCMQKFANNAALLLRAGVPLLEVIHSLQGIFESNVVYQQALARVESRIGSGGKMASALEETGVFTSLVTSMARIGEESGTLPEVLDQIDISYKRSVAAIVGRITSTLETVVILGMGIAVAVILCSIYLPMFSMAGAV